MPKRGIALLEIAYNIGANYLQKRYKSCWNFSQNAQSAQNTQNAQNAQNTQNAQNAQNA